MKQLDSLVDYVSETPKASHKREKMVKELEKRLTHQSPLRALSCVMISSKLASHTKV